MLQGFFHAADIPDCARRPAHFGPEGFGQARQIAFADGSGKIPAGYAVFNEDFGKIPAGYPDSIVDSAVFYIGLFAV
jgi:hypothetical protein